MPSVKTTFLKLSKRLYQKKTEKEAFLQEVTLYFLSNPLCIDELIRILQQEGECMSP
jgi:hypothetical protein